MKLKHVISAEQVMDRGFLRELFRRADGLASADVKGGAFASLKGKVLACLFYEPSTRTRFSFQAAMYKLGGNVVSLENLEKSSSVAKGESFKDTIKIVSGYTDCIVLRHPKEGAAQEAASVSSVPVINAGDGGNEHPTQALLDLYTILKEKGRLENLKVAFGFDPLHSRTIRSLALALSDYPGSRFTFISPQSLRAPSELTDKLNERHVPYKETEDLDEGLDVDVLYVNRLQQERFQESQEFEKNRKLLVVTPDKVQGKDILILDPLPRIDEIDSAVDALPNAAYFRQARNGLYVRMALLEMLLHGDF